MQWAPSAGPAAGGGQVGGGARTLFLLVGVARLLLLTCLHVHLSSGLKESNGAVVSPTAHTAPLPGFPAQSALPVGATDLLTHSESSGTGGSSRGSRRTACLRTPPETSAGRPVCDLPDAAADEDLAYVHRNGHRHEQLQPEDLMAARGAISTEDLMRGPPCGRCVGLGLRGGPRARTAGFDSFR